MTEQPSGHVFIAVTLDGFIARADGGVDWLDPFNGTDEDTGYDTFMSGIDAVVMGRNTFEKILTFGQWPFQVPVLVLSSSLTEDGLSKHLKDKVSISNASPQDVVLLAASRSWHHLYVDGGATIRAFLAAGLVRELVLTRVPVLLGSGIPLFGEVAISSLEHLETRAFRSGLVQSRYRLP